MKRLQTSETSLLFQILSAGFLVAGAIWCGGACWVSHGYLYLIGAMNFAVGLSFLACAYGTRADTSANSGRRVKRNRRRRLSVW